MEIRNEIRALLQDVTKFRRDLHQIPELGLQEFKTCQYLKSVLTNLDVQEVHEVLDTGLVAVFRGNKPGKTLAFRTDIDALPVTEESGVAFCSQHQGRMHACGHDGHMATMLGFAKYLSEHPEEICGTVVLIFQPAEEGPGGAQLMIEAGIIEKFGIEQIIGLHVFPDFNEGVIACKQGGMMARNGEVTITVQGKSAHGAQPQQGADAILATAAIIQGLHTIISRNISPLDSAVLTFGEIHGGEAMNIIPGKVELFGTLRVFSDTVYEKITKRILTLTKDIATAYDCRATIDFNHMYRVVDNDAKMVAALKKVAKDSYVTSPPYLLAEDFSMFQQKIPGLFFFVGIKNEEKDYIYPLHSSKLRFDEKNLLGGIQCYVDLIHVLNEKGV
ncbi:peptidase [Enterococcus saigonensis]|uniref:Peptidase n=1 Tax=Enterococcus saigonensis TaxID=1805431 RepID=A0A679I650_9ENTE|nr:M20 family metallopeptidase [Enterococcus saigonensis]BCA85038.1 peptidase [Enterococcus saigonensis]